MAKNVYYEMLEGLKIPERLSPENIAAMLDAASAESVSRKKISVSSASSQMRSSEDYEHINVQRSSASKSKAKSGRSFTVVYRTVASLAACAAMVFGLVRYFDVGEAAFVDSDVKGSTYAADYDELHKTFRKYYVDDEDKITLDSAVEEIAPSYNDAADNSVGDNVVSEPGQTQPDQPVPDNTDNTQSVPDNSDPEQPGEENPADPEVPSAPEAPRIPEFVPDESSDNILVSGNMIFVKDGSTVKVVLTSGGKLDYIGDAVPEHGLFESKTLEDIYAVDSRLIAVYSVVTEEPASVPAFEDGGDTVVGELMNSIYSDKTASVKTNSVEVVIYDIYPDGTITASSVISQSGRLISSVFKNSYVYVVTSYDDYRRTPLNGVDDLETYVPSYTVNGEKRYISPENILIPQYVATTDYTVVSGIAAALPNVPVSVQAVLGSEGKVIVTDSSVYVFGYSKQLGAEKTTVEQLSLNYGTAHFEGSAFLEGVAIKGGITESDGTIIVATLRNTDAGYITSVNAMDSSMNLVSKAYFPAAMKTVSFSGKKVYLTNGTDYYAADFTDPSSPENIEYIDDIDVTGGLVEFADGYVTLTKDENGALILSRLKKNAEGDLYSEFETVVCDSNATSKALKDNRIMYCDPANGYVGVPFGYYDGFDYCYKFVLYKMTATGFDPVDQIESHEAEDSFEFGRAVLSGGILYIFSEGRIYSAAVGENAMSIIGSADLIDSSYSGHTSW